MPTILILGFKAPESWQKAFSEHTLEHCETGQEALELFRKQAGNLAVVVFGKRFSRENPPRFSTLYNKLRAAGFHKAFIPNAGEELYILKAIERALAENDNAPRSNDRYTDKSVLRRSAIPSSTPPFRFWCDLAQKLAARNFAHLGA